MGIELILLPQEFWPDSRRQLGRQHICALKKWNFLEAQALLYAFQNHGNSLAHTDAHGAERISAIGSQELVERGGYKPRAAGTQRVPESNRTAVRVHARRVVRNSQFAQDSQRL